MIADSATLTVATFFFVASAKFVSRGCKILTLADFEGRFAAKLALCTVGLLGREIAIGTAIEGHSRWNTAFRSLGILGGMKVCSIAHGAIGSPVSWIPFAVSMVIVDNFLWFPLSKRHAIKNIQEMQKELISHHDYLISEQFNILSNQQLITTYKTDTEDTSNGPIYLQDWRRRSSNAISNGRRYGVSVNTLESTVETLETYLKKMEHLDQYQGEVFEEMSLQEMKAIQEKMFKGIYALNAAQIAQWNARIDDLLEKGEDFHSYGLVYFATSYKKD